MIVFFVIDFLTKPLVQDRTSEMELMQKLKDKIRDLLAQLSNVQFTYRDPVKNFDRSKVKGVVARLIKVKDSSTMTALEVSSAYIIPFVLQQ